MNDQTKLVRKYLTLTFMLTYLTWGGIVIANMFGFLQYGTRLFMVFYMIGGNAPAIISIACILHSKTMTVKQFFKTIFEVKQSPLHYLIVFLLLALEFGMFALLGKITVLLPLYLAIAFVPIMIIGGGLEELGWRFILQPAMQRKFPFPIATLLTALIWAVWHLPLFYIEGTLQSTQNFINFTIFVIGLSFILATIYRISESIWLCILFHSAYNALLESLAVEQELVACIVVTLVVTIVSLVIDYYFARNKPKKTV